MNFLYCLMMSFFGFQKATAAKKISYARLHIEQLEGRNLLSGGIESMVPATIDTEVTSNMEVHVRKDTLSGDLYVVNQIYYRLIVKDIDILESATLTIDDTVFKGRIVGPSAYFDIYQQHLTQRKASLSFNFILKPEYQDIALNCTIPIVCGDFVPAAGVVRRVFKNQEEPTPSVLPSEQIPVQSPPMPLEEGGNMTLKRKAVLQEVTVELPAARTIFSIPAQGCLENRIQQQESSRLGYDVLNANDEGDDNQFLGAFIGTKIPSADPLEDFVLNGADLCKI